MAQSDPASTGGLSNRGLANTGLDRDLRGYLETNADIVRVIEKPVSIENIGALSAQSEGPILFENITEYPGFRL